MRLRWIIAASAATLFVAGVGVWAVGGSDPGAGRGQAIQVRAAPAIFDEPAVSYPADLVAGSRQVADALWKGDPVRFTGADSDTVVLVAKQDLVRMVTAQRARTRELPYREADLLAPGRDADGKVVGYILSGVGFLAPSVVSAPGFDVCSTQVAQLRDEDKVRSSHPELAVGLDDARATPEQRLHCTPR